jgi:hypothetical protein
MLKKIVDFIRIKLPIFISIHKDYEQNHFTNYNELNNIKDQTLLPRVDPFYDEIIYRSSELIQDKVSQNEID